MQFETLTTHSRESGEAKGSVSGSDVFEPTLVNQQHGRINIHVAACLPSRLISDHSTHNYVATHRIGGVLKVGSEVDASKCRELAIGRAARWQRKGWDKYETHDALYQCASLHKQQPVLSNMILY